MKTGSCIERITVSTFQTLYREGLLSLEKTTLASLINIENACMNAWRLWIVDYLNVCMYECTKTLNFWLFECMHVWMHENFEFLIVWMYACMLGCVKIWLIFSLSSFFLNQMLFSNHWIYRVRKIFFFNNLWQILGLAGEFKTLLTPPSITFCCMCT